MLRTNTKPNVGVVIPTCRDVSFLEEWEDTDLENCTLYVVEDKPKKTFKIPDSWDAYHFSHKEIDKFMGKDSWIIARGDGGIKSFGLMMAYYGFHDYVICLDDDVHPIGNKFVEQHILRLKSKCVNSKFINSLNSEEVFARGVPYSERKKKKVVFNMGMWTMNPDFDALTSIAYRGEKFKLRESSMNIPRGCYFPHCVMNVSMIRDVIPAFYQLLMGPKFSMYRFDDIWSGIFLKKIIDYNDHAVTIGPPFVVHTKESNIWTNLRKEVNGLEYNELLWKVVDGVTLESGSRTYRGLYKDLAERLLESPSLGRDKYFRNLFGAMKIWTTYFESDKTMEGNQWLMNQK